MDQYEVLEVIGSGSFGRIHKVRRKADNKIIARKEIHYGSMTDKEKIQLVSEVNIIRELHHPNIVKYYERFVNKERSTIYIFMEHCGGGDLSCLIGKAKKDKTYIDEETIWKILTQVLCGLCECHTNINGVVLHRDLKPENIFLDDHLNAKIGDFGLSRLLDERRNMANSFVGTPYYMSPEQINDLDYDMKSDIWSLGCIVYELCSLNPPFEATNQISLSSKINKGLINRLPSHYSSDLCNVIKAMLQIDPVKRPCAKDFFRVPQIRMQMKERRLNQRALALRIKEEQLQKKERELLNRESELKRKESLANTKTERVPLKQLSTNTLIPNLGLNTNSSS